MFQFKQFAIDQTGCAMKINTDGVLLGALANANNPAQILDIGTGTGVIALMLAQRFPDAKIDAVEIDEHAAATSTKNFAFSKFAERLTCYYSGFEGFLDAHSNKKYDLIISNPPFYLHSLKSPGKQKAVAKHTDEQFFDTLVETSCRHLSPTGELWLILPIETSAFVQQLAASNRLHTKQITEIQSYLHSVPHRHVIAFSVTGLYLSTGKLVIYDRPKVYSEQYKNILKNFFTIF